MPVTVVQTTTNTNTTNIPAENFGAGTRSVLHISATFPSPITSGNTIIVGFVGDIISPGLNLTPGPTPSLSTTAGGSLPSTTYYVTATYVDSSGNETAAGAEQSLLVTSGNLLVINSPANPLTVSVAGATGWNVYVGLSSGSEVKQNGSPLSFGTNYTEPTGGFATSGGGSPNAPIKDTLGLAFSTAVWVNGGQSGSQFGTHALGFFYADATSGGTEALSMVLTGFNSNPIFAVDAYLSMMAIEVSGFSSPVVQGSAYHQQANSTGDLSATITDSGSVSRVTDFGSVSEASIAVVDLVSGGHDEFFAIGGKQGVVPLPTITGGIYSELASTSIPGSMNAYLWTAGPDVIVPACPGGYQRGNIDWDQIGMDARQGPCYGIKVQYADGNFTPGNTPVFLVDGTLGDGGGASGAGSGIRGLFPEAHPNTLSRDPSRLG